ncbi:hypothetical protein NDN08_003338 [Rhodosorus marinus]|uniref:CBM20 domain-containing protein n=1 Tax=Rhodosorus marinus TaxID=101924 RepID=A0AAV8UWG0_9RHOD|nr:hypothetical protein NDN08_003338 [Rhodosorus marinus]
MQACHRFIFSVSLETGEGEGVFVLGSLPELGKWNVRNAIPMTRLESEEDGDCLWQVVVDFGSAPNPGSTFEYRYFVALSCGNLDPGQSIRWERRSERKAVLKTGDVLLGRSKLEDTHEQGRLRIPRRVAYGQNLYILGAPKEIGSWNPSRAKRMNWKHGNDWGLVVNFRLATLEEKFEYKVLVIGDEYESMSHLEQKKAWKVRGELRTAVWGEDWQSCEKVEEVHLELGEETRTRETWAEVLEAVAAQKARVSELQTALKNADERYQHLQKEMEMVQSAGHADASAGEEKLQNQLTAIEELLRTALSDLAVSVESNAPSESCVPMNGYYESWTSQTRRKELLCAMKVYSAHVSRLARFMMSWFVSNEPDRVGPIQGSMWGWILLGSWYPERTELARSFGT